jgi:hypothetical protein
MTFCKPDVLKPDVLKTDVLEPDVLKPDVLWVYPVNMLIDGGVNTSDNTQSCEYLRESSYTFATASMGQGETDS